jgi:hypothetical protein
VNNSRALRIEPTDPAYAPNIIAGYSGNSVTTGVVGATIAGGGGSGSLNVVTDDGGTVGGGWLNQAGDNGGTTSDKACATVGGGYNNTGDTVAADGKETHSEYFAKPDGKDYPMRSESADAIWVKKIDDHNNEWTTKKGGKVVASGKTSYSKDGKMRTLTWTEIDDKGKKFENIAIYARQ